MTSFFVFVLFVLFVFCSVLFGKLRYGAPPPDLTDRDLAALVHAGKTRKALRWYRMRYGVGQTAARRGLERVVAAVR